MSDTIPTSLIKSLPTEILDLIFSFLCIPDLLSSSYNVNKAWQQLTDAQLISRMLPLLDISHISLEICDPSENTTPDIPYRNANPATICLRNAERAICWENFSLLLNGPQRLFLRHLLGITYFQIGGERKYYFLRNFNKPTLKQMIELLAYGSDPILLSQIEPLLEATRKLPPPKFLTSCASSSSLSSSSSYSSSSCFSSSSTSSSSSQHAVAMASESTHRSLRQGNAVEIIMEELMPKVFFKFITPYGSTTTPIIMLLILPPDIIVEIMEKITYLDISNLKEKYKDIFFNISCADFDSLDLPIELMNQPIQQLIEGHFTNNPVMQQLHNNYCVCPQATEVAHSTTHIPNREDHCIFNALRREYYLLQAEIASEILNIPRETCISRIFSPATHTVFNVFNRLELFFNIDNENPLDKNPPQTKIFSYNETSWHCIEAFYDASCLYEPTKAFLMPRSIRNLSIPSQIIINQATQQGITVERILNMSQKKLLLFLRNCYLPFGHFNAVANLSMQEVYVIEQLLAQHSVVKLVINFSNLHQLYGSQLDGTSDSIVKEVLLNFNDQIESLNVYFSIAKNTNLYPAFTNIQRHEVIIQVDIDLSLCTTDRNVNKKILMDILKANTLSIDRINFPRNFATTPGTPPHDIGIIDLFHNLCGDDCGPGPETSCIYRGKADESLNRLQNMLFNKIEICMQQGICLLDVFKVPGYDHNIDIIPSLLADDLKGIIPNSLTTTLLSELNAFCSRHENCLLLLSSYIQLVLVEYFATQLQRNLIDQDNMDQLVFLQELITKQEIEINGLKELISDKETLEDSLSVPLQYEKQLITLDCTACAEEKLRAEITNQEDQSHKIFQCSCNLEIIKIRKKEALQAFCYNTHMLYWISNHLFNDRCTTNERNTPNPLPNSETERLFPCMMLNHICLAARNAIPEEEGIARENLIEEELIERSKLIVSF